MTLGFSILDKAKIAQAWDVISNEEIVRVNQAYHGHPGRLVRAWSVNGTLGDTAGGCADAVPTATAISAQTAPARNNRMPNLLVRNGAAPDGHGAALILMGSAPHPG